MSLFQIALTFFLVTNPIGNSPMIVSLVKDFDFEKQKRILFREGVIALIIALFFQYFGELFLGVLNIKDFAVSMTGGVLLFLVALSMIFSSEPEESKQLKQEPFIVPIATPILAGPGLMAIIMLYARQENNNLKITAALLLAWVFILAIVATAPYLKKILGKRGLVALEQLMGMLLAMMSMGMILKAIRLFVEHTKKYVEFNMEIPLITLTLILFLIMDPIGSVSSYLKLAEGISPKRMRFVLVREMLIALGFMLLFNVVGEYIFDILQLDKETVEVASAVILFLTAIKILFPASNSLRSNLPAGEPFIIPLAVPLIAGPSLLATIMLLANLEPCLPCMLYAILIAWALSFLVLFFAKPLQRILGNNGLMAAERLTGMLLVMLAIQRGMEGIQEFIALLK